MGQPGGQRGSRRHRSASEAAVGAAGTQLGVVAWPPARRDRWFGGWHYWWQAHLLDCLVDAEQRDPQPERRIKINRQIRSHRLRNNGSWVNNYYDDMAWLALALERASRIAGVDRERALHKLNDQLVNAWVPEDGGGIPWRKQDQFFNAPANGPAGCSWRATATGCGAPADGRLDRRDADRPRDAPGVRRHQGGLAGPRAVHLLPGRGSRPGDRAGRPHPRRPPCAAGSPPGRRRRRTHGAGGVLRGSGGGDGGLFSGITARYLALVATTLPGNSAADTTARDTACDIVLSSAQAAWDNRQTVQGLPLFGPSWDDPPSYHGRWAAGAVRHRSGQRLGDPRA